MSAQLSPITTDVDFDKEGKQVGYLRAPHSRNSSAWGSILIPITVVKNGRGPTVLFVGGSHGGEYEGPISLIKVGRELKAEAVQGRVIIIPALNLPAVLAGQRLSPIDGKDMNRVFPGATNGTITFVIAHYLHEVVLPLCDAVIDLHSGGYSLRMLPYMSMHYLDNALQNEQTFAALEAFDAPISLIINEISGEGLLDYAVEAMGKIFLCAEIGGAATLTPRTLQLAETGVWNLLKHFKLVEGELVKRPKGSRMMEVPGPDYYHTALSTGIYETQFELGDQIEPGQTIGQIHFVENISREPETIIAKQAGMLLCTRGPGYVELGDCVAVIARDLQ